MQETDLNHEIELAKLVGLMAAAYPNTQVTKETVKVYTSLLKDIPLDLLTASVQQCMSESEFLPTVAKIREKALSLSQPVSPEPFEAWGIVLQEIRSKGYTKIPKFDNPIIKKAVDCIGWMSLCSSENQITDRAHFAKVYEGLVRQAENDRRMIPAARQIQDQVKLMIAGHSMEDAA
jgi:Loader and inhibitor of phage G40P